MGFVEFQMIGLNPIICLITVSMYLKMDMKLNKLVNADLKHLLNWLNANKISLTVKN